MTDIFTNKKCTFYRDIMSRPVKGGNKLTHPGKVVPLLDVLTKDGYTNSKLLNEMRNSGYKSKFYDANKRYLSAIACSSIQDDLTIDRTDANHLFHSGFIAFDVDVDKNPSLLQPGGTEYLFETITQLPYVAYCGRSVSNIGLWGLIPIARPEDHDGHFLAICQALSEVGVNIDAPLRDISRLRFLSYDEDAYFELQPKIFDKSLTIESEVLPLYNSLPDRPRDSDQIFWAAVNWVKAKHEIEFVDGYKHIFLTYLYANLRYARVPREQILGWVYDHLIAKILINSNCLDEIDIRSKI